MAACRSGSCKIESGIWFAIIVGPVEVVGAFVERPMNFLRGLVVEEEALGLV